MADGEHLDSSKPTNETIRISNTNKVLLNKLQAIAVCRGFSCRLKFRDNNSIYENTKQLGHLTLSKSRFHQCAPNEYSLQKESIWIDEMVWCVKVESSFIIARRNGIPFVTGNCEGFNWTSAAIIGMCIPTSNRAAYIQRAGRGTRPLQGILDGLQSADDRRRAINQSEKPFMTVLDFVGVSSNLTLIGHESVLDENQEINEQEPKTKSRKQESEGESVDESEAKGLGIDTRIRAISSGIQSTTLHSTESFDPFEETFQSKEAVKLTSKVQESGKVMLSEKQYNVIKRNGIDDNTLTSQQAQELVKFIAGNGFRLNPIQKGVLKRLYREVKYGTKKD